MHHEHARAQVQRVHVHLVHATCTMQESMLLCRAASSIANHLCRANMP